LKKYFKIVSLMYLFICSPSVLALKLEGHVFVGQQIINDIESDGMLTFTLGNRIVKIPVQTHIKNSILNNKAEFLLGNIGPDVFPDVVVGQTVVHPGIEGGWKTNDWLAYLLEQTKQGEQATAFAYGYLGHASTDVFAHTYVNQYAGDTFEIFDENLVEKRHVVLEGFIDKHLPPLKDYQGNLLPQAYQLLDIDESFSVYLRDTLLYNEDVLEQYKQAPYAAHLMSIISFRNKLNDFANDGIWKELDIIITQYVASYWGIELSREDADKVVDAANDVLESVHSAEDEIQEALNEVYDVAAEFEAVGFERIINATDKLENSAMALMSSKHELESKVLSLDAKLRENACHLIGNLIEDPLGVLDPLGIADPLNLTDKITDKIPALKKALDPLGLFGSSSAEKPKITWSLTGNKSVFLAEAARRLAIVNERKDACNSTLKESTCSVYYAISFNYSTFKSFVDSIPAGETVTYNTWNYNLLSYTESDGNGFLCDSINKIADTTQRELLRAVQRIERDILTHNIQLKNDLANLHREMNSIRDEVFAMENTIFDFGQSLSQNLNPIESYLKHWVSDIDLAMKEYVKATGNTMVNTINPEVHADPNRGTLDPLKDWVECYGLSVFGIGGATCDILNSVASIENSLGFIFELSNKAPLPTAIRNKVNEYNLNIIDFKNKIKDEAKDDIYEELYKYIPEEIQEIIQINDFSAASLNRFYTLPETKAPLKHLVFIPDMADRVKTEMHLSNGFLDIERFPVIRNAIVLSKIALLDFTGLRELEVAAGVPYGTLSLQTDNVVASAFTNLDGNHQWMEKSPPLPNSVGVPYRNKDAKYGTHINNNGVVSHGLLLWQENVRDKLFNSLFIGPLSPGIDFPSSINKGEIIPEDYPYKPCIINPFPDDINDESCNLSWLIPIINMTLQ